MSLSLLIPCFNAEAYLAQAIESALRQTRPADEILVVDDGSTDGSRAVAARYPVRRIDLPSNSGPAAARNVAIREARGEILVWLDADDYFEPNHLEIVVGLLERFPEAAVAFSVIRLVGDRTGVYGKLPDCSGRPANIFWRCLIDTVLPTSSAAVRRSALERVGGYDERFRYSEDFDLWLRLSRHELFVSSDEVTSSYRRHSAQASTNRRAQRRAVYESRRLLLQRLRDEGEAELAERVAARVERLWEIDTLAAWAARDRDEFLFHLALAPLLPRAAAAPRFRWWARVPSPALAAWDRLRRRRRPPPAAAEGRSGPRPPTGAR